MSSQNKQYIDLDECIYDYISESEQSVHKYHKLWYLAFRALTELGLDFFYSIKSVKLPVSDTKTVKLPEDYTQYSKVGILNEKGEVATLVYNNKLTTYADLLPDRIEKIQGEYLGGISPINGNTYYNYWSGGYWYNLYGVPSGQPFIGSFKIDNDNGVIVLNPNFAYDYIILEYAASPKEGQQLYVPIQFKEAIIAYLRWKDIISIPSKTHVNNSNVQMRRHDYYNERRLARDRFKPFRIDEAYDANLQMQRLTVKV